MESYDLALAVKPNDYWTWYQKGIIWQQLSQFDQAINCYQAALHVDSKSSLIWYQLACCYALQKNPNWAIISLEKAIDLDPHKYLDAAVNQPEWQEFRRQVGFQLLIKNKSKKYSR